MPDIAELLGKEIGRLAKIKVREELESLTKQLKEIKQIVSEQNRRLTYFEKAIAKQAKQAGESESEAEAAPSEGYEISVKRPRSVRMTPAAVKSLRKRLKLSQRDMGLLMDVSANTVIRWEAGKSAPREANREAFTQLKEMGLREVRAKLKELKADI